MKRAVSVELAKLKRGLNCPAVPVTESFPYGVVVAIPMFPLDIVVPVPSMPCEKIRLPMLSWFEAVLLGASTS